MSTKLIPLALLLGATSLAAISRGESVTVRSEFPAELMVPDTTGGDPVAKTYTVHLAQFNPQLGTLNSVTFTLDFDFQIVLTGNETMGGSGGGSVSGEVYVNNLPQVFIGGGNGGGGGVGPGMEFVIPVPQFYEQTAVPGGGGFGDMFAGEFVGTGEVELDYVATATLLPTMGTMRVELTDTVAPFMSVTYDYTPVASPAAPGDYNADGQVDAIDYTVWRNNLGRSVLLPGDLTPGEVDVEDYALWKERYGEPAEGGLALGQVRAVPVPGGMNWLGALLVLAFRGGLRRMGGGDNDQFEKQLQQA